MWGWEDRAAWLLLAQELVDLTRVSKGVGVEQLGDPKLREFPEDLTVPLCLKLALHVGHDTLDHLSVQLGL